MLRNTRIESIQNEWQRINAVREEKENNLKAINKALSELNIKQDIGRIAAEMAKRVYDQRVAKFIDSLENIVSYGLTKVFDKSYTFKIEYKSNGIKFQLASDSTGDEYTDIVSAHGGGCVQLCAFLLHIYALVHSKADKVMMLDEAFSQVSKEYKQALATLITELSEQMGFQFIMVSHDFELMEYLTDSTKSIQYRVEQQNEATVIKRIETIK